MTKTENLQLPQWEAEDYVQRSDFNEAFAVLDEGYSTAMTAAENAETAVTTYRSYVVGTYTGTGEAMEITVGFRPSFVIVNGTMTSSTSTAGWLSGFNLGTAGNNVSDLITFTDTGFYLTELGNTKYPNLIVNGRIYDYIAFR